jgi:hypothetical protein
MNVSPRIMMKRIEKHSNNDNTSICSRFFQHFHHNRQHQETPNRISVTVQYCVLWPSNLYQKCSNAIPLARLHPKYGAALSRLEPHGVVRICAVEELSIRKLLIKKPKLSIILSFHAHINSRSRSEHDWNAAYYISWCSCTITGDCSVPSILYRGGLGGMNDTFDTMRLSRGGQHSRLQSVPQRRSHMNRWRPSINGTSIALDFFWKMHINFTKYLHSRSDKMSSSKYDDWVSQHRSSIRYEKMQIVYYILTSTDSGHLCVLRTLIARLMMSVTTPHEPSAQPRHRTQLQDRALCRFRIPPHG